MHTMRIWVLPQLSMGPEISIHPNGQKTELNTIWQGYTSSNKNEPIKWIGWVLLIPIFSDTQYIGLVIVP